MAQEGLTRAMAALDEIDGRDDPYFAEFSSVRALLEGPEWRRGLEELVGLAHRGSIMSMLLVSGCMLEGWGYDQDLPGAEAWYSVAAESGSVRGYFGLGLAHQRMGRFDEAIADLEVAISMGYPPAYNALAYIYSHGNGVPIDRRRALDLWRTGSSLGHLYSKLGLIRALIHGYAGVGGRVEGWVNVIPLIVELVRAKLDPIPIGSGRFHRVR